MRSRQLLFGFLLLACSIAAGVALASGLREGDAAPVAGSGARDALASAVAGRQPALMFRSSARAGGQVALAALAPAPGRQVALPLRCDRVYFDAGSGVCLARGGGFAHGFQAKVFGTDLRVRARLDVDGVPSRARVSPDGRYGSVTLFVTGHSYSAAGAFSTQTTLIDLVHGKKLAQLEDFVVTRDGRRITAIDVNFWGVTFARDSDRFYATLATGGKTYLIEGSVRARTAHVVHDNVECPSLSPDGTRIAYKRRTKSAARPWRLTVLDIATMHETPLAETRSVDDQAEWIDDDRVIYGVDGAISVVPADGSGAPRTFMAHADSPAVVRG